ncbi:MAG: class E sortase [Methanobacteriaceae archaeon]
MKMRKYQTLSLVVVLCCVFLSANIAVMGYQQLKEVNKAQKSVADYKERMSAPVDVLDPQYLSSNRINAQLFIPKLYVTANIRSDTVNAYNSVYHYTESVMPGENGECGILGHRTKYSGLFTKIASLVPGDQAIIKDYTKNKRYVYVVTSNGNDIRWDYKTNPIRFSQEGQQRLLIVTCYPPGRKKAAWITHLKLVSVSDLKS